MAAVVKFKNQDYRSLYRSLLRRGEKFMDPTFPAGASSIRSGSSGSDVEWLRPSELTSRPRLVVNGVSGGDVMQGERGNAWFVTASAALTARRQLLTQVLPNLKAQEYGAGFHPGVFVFRFYRNGCLYDVVIDDQLPTRRGRLLFCQSSDADEFWSCLLEKAYAKLHGDYHCLQDGRVVDAVASFVRGVPEHWDLAKVRAEVDTTKEEVLARLWKLFRTYHRKESFVMFSLKADGSRNRTGDWTPQNLVFGRGYILMDVQLVKLKDGSSVHLLKLLNSWSDREWSGAWADSSPDWQSLTQQSREQLNHQFKSDGLFWMTIGDAVKQFTHIDICLVTSAANSLAWVTRAFSDEWNVTPKRNRSQRNAGGSYEYTDSYITNPQYLLTIRSEGKQSVSLCLEQGTVSAACRTEQLASIGLDVFKVEDNRRVRLKEPPDASWFKARVEPDRQPNRFLGAVYTPGAYVVVPCTQLPGTEQRYTLRAVSQQGFGLQLLATELPSQGPCCLCCYWRRVAVTQLSITKITGICSFLKKRKVKVMVRVSCEGSDVTNWDSGYTACDANDPNSHPVDFKLLLYKHDPKQPIDIQIFHKADDSFMKHFVANTRVKDIDCVSPTEKEVQLYENNQPINAHVHCQLHMSDDINFF